MPTTVPARRTRRPMRPGRVVGALVAGALAVTVAPLPTAQATESATGTTTTKSDVTMVHANILSQLSTERFQADVRTVLAKKPDLITYNEVPLRQDSVIAPSGYDVQRSKANRYTAATAVAWRTDRWTEVDSGTFRISNYRKIPPGRNIRLGLRFANWVTLRSPEGRQLSVVAAHVPPLDRNMPDLLRPSVRRVGELVEKLAPSGPVLVGGDFNVHYTSGRYPRDLFDDARMVPTYDTLGGYFPTGDHRGATIDYLFNRGEGILTADQQSKFELNSDHDGVMAGFAWQVDPPAATEEVVSDPAGDQASQRRVMAAIGQELRSVQGGSQVEVVTSGFGPHRLYRRVKGAVARGVQVRLITRSETLTERERKLARFARDEGLPGSEVRRCRNECAQAWRQSGMARGFLLVRNERGQAVKRMDVNRFLNPSMLERRTRLTVRTGEIALTRGEEMLAALT